MTIITYLLSENIPPVLSRVYYKIPGTPSCIIILRRWRWCLCTTLLAISLETSYSVRILPYVPSECTSNI